MQLRRIGNEDLKEGVEHEEREYGVFLHRKDDKIYDFEDIRNEIIAQTNK